MKHFVYENENETLIDLANNVGEFIKKFACRNGFITEIDSGKFWEVRNSKLMKKSHHENKRGGVRV